MSVLIRIKDADNSVVAHAPDGGEKAILLENSFYFLPEQVDMTYLKKTDAIYRCPYKGVAYWYDLEAPGISAKKVAWVYEDPMAGYEHIGGRIAFYMRETSATHVENKLLTS